MLQSALSSGDILKQRCAISGSGKIALHVTEKLLAYGVVPVTLSVVVGETDNFAAYAFAPAILVTPLDALSIIIRHKNKKAKLNPELATKQAKKPRSGATPSSKHEATTADKDEATPSSSVYKSKDEDVVVELSSVIKRGTNDSVLMVKLEEMPKELYRKWYFIVQAQ
ncbi:hypothetical protein Droror1_Dr00019425 [Drosera rotundifolia]